MSQKSVSLKGFENVRALRTQITDLEASATISGTYNGAKQIVDDKKRLVREPLVLKNAVVLEAKTQWFKVDQDGTQYWIRPLEIEGTVGMITLEYDEEAYQARLAAAAEPKPARKKKDAAEGESVDADFEPADEEDADEDEEEDEEDDE